MMPEVADGESEDETAVPSVSPPKPRMPGQKWTLAPGSLLRPAGCSAWEDFRGAGADGGEEAWKEGASDHFDQGPAGSERFGNPAPLQVPPLQEPC